MEIEYKNVSYIYNRDTSLRKKAIDNLSIAIKDNKINGIIGQSGSGKTTMIEMLEALLIPTTGNVKVDEFNINGVNKIRNINNLRKRVGIVFQFPEEQFFNLTVKKEIEFGLLNLNYRTKEIDKRIKDSLLMVGLDESYLDRDPFTLSNGEQRKVAIASTLAYNPKLLVFDEPTIGLDDDSKNLFIKMIRNLKNKFNKTIIIVSHDLDMLNEIVDYAIVINKGKVLLEGNKYNVFTNNILEKYNIGIPKVIEFEKLVLEKKGIKLGFRDNVNDLLKDIYRNVR